MSLSERAHRRLARAVEELAGIVVETPAHRVGLDRAVTARAGALGFPDGEEYVQRLLVGSLPGEWARLLSAITVKESYCFRGARQLEAFATRVLPDIVAAGSSPRTVRVWSAGCARGEEAATLAVILAEHLGPTGWDWRVLGTDIDPDALRAAGRWRFGRRAVRAIPQVLLERYFRSEGNEFVLAPELAARIELKEMNLVAEPFAPPAPRFDAVFLRNVLIYFRPESQLRIIRNIAGCLAPRGRLVLGPTEALWHRVEELEVEDLGTAFFYRKRGRSSSAPPPGSREPKRRTTPVDLPTDGGSGGEQPGTRRFMEEVVRQLELGRVGEARRLLGRQQLIPVLDPLVHALRGCAARAEGDFDSSVAAFRAALYLEPRLFQVRLLLAEALLGLGSKERARRELRQVLRDAPHGPELPWAHRLGIPGRGQVARHVSRLLAASGP